jgi:hypothetical protein
MLAKIREARKQERQAICEMIFAGQRMAQLLSLARKDPTIPQDFKIAAANQLRKWNNASQLYKDAGQARDILLKRSARERSISKPDSVQAPS